MAPVAEPAWSPLVPIQAGTALPPFFCVHGAGGNVVNVRDLARYLGSQQPFYGLQARGTDGRLLPLHRIEDMARLYLAEIRALQPHGPYYLGGYSGGGVIAFEMAHQLLREGERAAILAFIDTFCPALPSLRGLQGTLRNFRAEGAGYIRHLPKKGLDVLLRKVRRAQVRYLELRGEPLPHELRYLRMWDTNLAAIRAYRPWPYPGRIALFRAAVGDATHAYDVPDLGWGPYAEDGVELYEIPGTHDTLVLEPHVQVLAAHLRAYIDRARAGDTRFTEGRSADVPPSPPANAAAS
jgi:thioesterase domain-containing protein